MKPCSNPLCTNQVENTDRFCGLCGTYVGPDITQGGAACPNCGGPLQVGQKFCPNCGSAATWVNQEQSTLIGTQAAVLQAHYISLPLAVSQVTPEELAVVRSTVKNVYAPYMRKLISGPLSFLWNQANTGKVIMLQPEVDITDFTLQAAIDFTTKHGLDNENDPHVGFVFRLDSQTGEGYEFSWCFRKFYSGGIDSTTLTWSAHTLYTRSRLTGEPLPQANIGEVLIKNTNVGSEYWAESREDLKRSSLIAVVAQQHTLDLYLDLQHVGRVENLQFLQGRLGIHLQPARQWQSGDSHVEDLKVWIP